MTNETKLQAIPKTNIVIILVAVVVVALFFATLIYVIDTTGDISSQMSKQSLANWKIIGILLSLYTLTTPWRWQNRIISRANQHDMPARQIWGMLLLFCYASFVAPLIYGCVLFFWGLSFVEFCYFVALSIVGALAWAIYNLRQNS
jgi:hypothetical protein